MRNAAPWLPSVIVIVAIVLTVTATAHYWLAPVCYWRAAHAATDNGVRAAYSLCDRLHPAFWK